MINNYTPEKIIRLEANQNKSGLRLIISVLTSIIIVSCFIPDVNGQPVANFSVDVNTGCSPLTVTFTNNSTNASSYFWIYGDGYNSNATNTVHTYTLGNEYTVKLIAITAMEQDTAYATITVTQTVPATFTTPIPPDVCANEWIDFKWNLTFKNNLESVKWDFGDGRISNDMATYPMTHRYSANGSYNVTYITYNQGCNDTSITPITVSGPIAEYSITPDSACIDETVTFTVTNSTDVNQYRWYTGEGTIPSDWIVGDNKPFQHQYFSTNPKDVILELEGTTTNCSLTDKVYIFPVVAGIESDVPCAYTPIFFNDASEGSNLTHFWDFGDGTTSTDRSLFHTFSSEAEFLVTHVIKNPKGCTDTIVDTIYTYTPPILELVDTAWYICRGDSAQLSASGGDSIFWSPNFGLSNPNSYTPKAAPSYTNPYNVLVKDTATHCTKSKIVTVFVQQNINWSAISTLPIDSTNIIIGDTVFISLKIDSTATPLIDTNRFLYQWTPDYQVLSGLDNTNLRVLPLESTAYSLEMSDTLSCFTHEFEVYVKVTEAYKIGVPEAFTPNGDNINDEIRVNGWGIKRIVEFRIYNRWGKEVFFSDNAGTGWDGNIDGKPAAIDSYAYVVKAEMWSGETIVENGTFTLIR